MVRGCPIHRLFTLQPESMVYFKQSNWEIKALPSSMSRFSKCYCISAGEKGKYEGIDRESSRLVVKEVSDLWRAPTSSSVNISKGFTAREFAAALQHLKPGKAPGLDSICPSLYSMLVLL